MFPRKYHNYQGTVEYLIYGKIPKQAILSVVSWSQLQLLAAQADIQLESLNPASEYILLEKLLENHVVASFS